MKLISKSWLIALLLAATQLPLHADPESGGRLLQHAVYYTRRASPCRRRTAAGGRRGLHGAAAAFR